MFLFLYPAHTLLALVKQMQCTVSGAGVYGAFIGVQRGSSNTQFPSTVSSQGEVAIPGQEGVRGGSSSQQCSF